MTSSNLESVSVKKVQNPENFKVGDGDVGDIFTDKIIAILP